MTAPQIVVLGSLNMDLVVRVPRMPGEGETLSARSFMTTPGGKGANQAVACARMGARVAMIGRVGRDAFGAALRRTLEADGVDASRLAPAGDTSGIAVILVDDAGENRIAIVAGANAALEPRDADEARAVIAGAQILLMQFEVPIDTVVQAATIARDSGRTVVLNPAPVRALPDALWPRVDILVVNETEAATLAASAVETIDAAASAARALQRRGPACVIVTLGGDGVVVADERGCRHVESLVVQAVDTTAAGDTFIGALCAALANQASIDAAVALGVRAAALCVTRPGAQVSIPQLHELEGLPAVAAPRVLG